MIISHRRGHKIEFDLVKYSWVYSDNKEPINNERPCTRCSKMPTKEGYDACLGFVKGIKFACCGHGVEKGYIKK